MIQADYHIHTKFSSDSDAQIESIIKQAIDLGLQQICITDHMDYNYSKRKPFLFQFDIEEYKNTLLFYKQKYRNKIKLCIGVELGLKPEVASLCEELITSYPFDFIIGSSHLVDNMDPYFPEFWTNREEEEGYCRYFETILENTSAFENFDVYGHIDYVVRYGPNQNKNYTYKKYQDLFDKIFSTLIQKGKGIEINTGGFKYGLEFAHPQTDVLARYKELGGEIITIGSDAHKPEHLAYDFKRAEQVLKEVGFRYYTTFESREPTFCPL